MTNEYQLSYTASEIDEKLGKIDNMVSTVNGITPDENGNVEVGGDYLKVNEDTGIVCTASNETEETPNLVEYLGLC